MAEIDIQNAHTIEAMNSADDAETTETEEEFDIVS